MANIEKIRQAMLDRGLEALWLDDVHDRQYATGFHASDGAVLILRDKAYFITDSRYIEAAGEAVKDAELLLCGAANTQSAILRALLAENGVTALGAQDGSLSYSEYLRMQDALGVRFVPAQDITGRLRETKEAYELESIVRAQRIAEMAFDAVLGLIRPEMTENALAAELEYRMT
jgi:Xaa-Pro aminopeptidase